MYVNEVAWCELVFLELDREGGGRGAEQTLSEHATDVFNLLRLRELRINLLLLLRFLL